MVTITRCKGNPLIAPEDIKPSREDFSVVCTFNAGVTRLGDETLMLVRTAEKPTQEEGWVTYPVFNADTGDVEVHRLSKDDPDLDMADPRVIYYKDKAFLTSISHLRLARSADGLHFAADDHPAMKPQTLYEAFGIEDPRITFIDGKYYIDYVGVSHLGVSTCLATTEDFVSFERLGVMFYPSNRDVVIFPEKINGKYAAYHRPAPRDIGAPDIWLAYSSDLKKWDNHHVVMKTLPD